MLFIFVFLIFSLTTRINCQKPDTIVKVFTEARFKGQSVTINATNCVSPLPLGFDNTISSINTQNNCVNLYKDQECSGEFFEAKPDTPGHEWLWLWKTQDSEEEGFDDSISSIGPCEEECSSSRIHTVSQNTSSIIRIYHDSSEASYIRGNAFKLGYTTIDVDGCVPLRRKISPYGAAIQFMNSSLCIELHKMSNCTGPSFHRREWTPRIFLRNAPGWNTDTVSSVSICGYNCPSFEHVPTFTPHTVPPVFSVSNGSQPMWDLPLIQGSVPVVPKSVMTTAAAKTGALPTPYGQQTPSHDGSQTIVICTILGLVIIVGIVAGITMVYFRRNVNDTDGIGLVTSVEYSLT